MAIERKLARCRELAKDYVDGQTAKHIRELEAELLDTLRSMDPPPADEKIS
ncbi:hypothetical protein ACVINW_001422 [Bradyrhizobium sp. USDA 4461]